MPLEARRVADAAAFARIARPMLLRDEAAHALLLSVLDGIERGRWKRSEAWLVERDAAPVAVALRTPPHDPVLSEPIALEPATLEPTTLEPVAVEPAAVGTAVADAYLSGGMRPGGILGPDAVAEGFAARWSEATGTRAEVRTRLRLHRLDRLEPVPEPPGRMRVATAADRPLVRAWTAAFHAEATPDDPVEIDASTDRLLGPSSDLRVWEVETGPVSMAAALGPTAAGVRISAVYTPPEARGRGYATALVAALTRAQLDAGRRFCTLYTDQANPTSNALYRRIGYRPIRDDVHLRFVAPVPAAR